MGTWNQLFSIPQGRRSAWSVIAWWEKRRLAYNLILALVGIPALMLFDLFADLAGVLPPGEDPVEPLVVLLTPVLANIAYTAGWIVEVPVRWVAPRVAESLGPRLFKLGLGFSVLLFSLPAIIWGGVLLVRLVDRLG